MRVYLSNTKLKILFLYLIAYALLWFGYARFIVPIYGYSGFEWAPNKTKLFETLLVIVFFALSLPSNVKRPSDFFVHVHFLLPVVPMLVLYSAADLPRAYFYFVLLAFAIVCHVRKFKLPKIKGDMIPVPIMMWGLLSIAAIYILSIVLQGGLQYFNLNLLKRMNYELGADFVLDNFSHYAFYEPIDGEMLSYLVSKKDQFVHFELLDWQAEFKRNEFIQTEVSKKYSISELEMMAESQNFAVKQHFFDQKNYFVDTLWTLK